MSAGHKYHNVISYTCILFLSVEWTHLPNKVKSNMCILDHTQSTFFCFGKFLKKLVDDQCSSITKGSIYYIKHMCIQLFGLIRCLMGVSTMFYICTYCVFTWWGRIDQVVHPVVHLSLTHYN